MCKTKSINSRQSGFSLVELMVGLVIGLLATLVIMQVFSTFEGQKRSTTGAADAQTNGSIALVALQGHIQKAGYGLPLPNVDLENNALRCNPFPDFDPDNDGSTDNSTNIFPLVIQDGTGSNGSDDVTVRFSTTAMGSTPVGITNATNATGAGLLVNSNIGCNIDGDTNNDDIALIRSGTTCDMVTIDSVTGTNNNQRIILSRMPANPVVLAGEPQISCMGDWQDYTFQVVNNELQLNGRAIVSEVVNMQAQYGVSTTAGENNVTDWVDANGIWNNPTVATTRNRIKAIRLAIVLRNGLKEKQVNGANVTAAAPVAWEPLNGSTAPLVDLTAIPDWDQYRYRTFETIIPLRNLLWSRGAVE
jgi:type IV pilus assembly protein PilW